MFTKLLSIALALAALVILLAPGSSYAMRIPNPDQRGPVRDAGHRTLFMHDANNIRTTISNWGEFGNPDGAPGYFGFEYPSGSENDFLFSAGFWVGARVGEELLVSTTTDGDNGTNEFAPSRDDFLYHSNMFADEPYIFSLITVDDDGDWSAYRDDLNGDGEPSSDWDGPNEDANGDRILFYDPEPHIDEDSPGDISADMIDNDYDGLVDGADGDLDGDASPGSADDDGDGSADEDGAAMAAQHIIAIYDDADPREVQSPDPDGHTPLNIRVEQRTFSWTLADNSVNDALVVEALVRNIGEDTLKDVYFGLFADADVAAQGESGDPASADDWTYFDEELTMAVEGDDTTDADGDGPGLFAMKILRAPAEAGEYSVSYQNFDRISGGDPETNSDKYEMISRGRIANPSAWLGDWRFLVGFGSADPENPWQLIPGGTIEVVYALIGAGTLADLHNAAAEIQEFYDVGREDFFRGDYLPLPADPLVYDIGDGQSLQVSWPRYHNLPRFGGINLHYGDLDQLEDVWNMGREVEVQVDNLREGVPYYFAISIYDTSGVEGSLSDSTWLEPLSIPRKPNGLHIVSEGFHEIIVGWNPNRELDLAGYNLYRSADGGEFARVNQNPIAARSYADQLDEFAVFSYRLAAIDQNGNESAIYGADSLDTPVTGTPYILEPNTVLIVDETHDGNGRPGSPNDPQCDQFYRDVTADLNAFTFDELDYNQVRDGRSVITADIGRYETIIWHTDDKSVQSLSANTSKLQEFHSYGGRLIISGWDVLAGFSAGDNISFASDAFPCEVLGVGSARRSSIKEFVGARGNEGYPDLQLDAGKVPASWPGLDRIWSVEPLESSYSIYRWVSSDEQSAFNDLPCAVMSYHALTLGFPLYYMQLDGAKDFMERALSDVQSAPLDPLPAPAIYLLEPNYPNPFNSATVIPYVVPNRTWVTLAAYDLTGRRVALLYQGRAEPGRCRLSVNFETLPAGVYFYSLEANSNRLVRPMTLLK